MTLLAEPIAPPIPVEPSPAAAPQPEGEVKTKELIIVNWSGELDKVWPVMILSSTAAASGVRCKVFVTFWGLLPFVKDQKRIVGENWMQKMLTLMQRPGIDHLKLSKMNFMGMGPWMMGVLSKKYHVASPRELLEAATTLGVEFIPCQMTMDMFGLKREDLIDEMGEPAGAATAIAMMTEADASLFI
ncbi:MAG TPA: DsrE/DsrF/DrsH-like family protein [Candidatus Sulfotelmatobacter sp.]|nr:DsrE/DsrF/DrsH-like family protein [Candidatus Sulfotelmatobacter sp.]